VRTFILLAIAMAVVAAGFGLKTAFAPGSSATPASTDGTMAASLTLWPHEIHRNYQGMKDLPVNDVKEPF
jgi:hypothetical protein